MLIGHQSIKKPSSTAHTDPNYDVNKGDYVVIYMVLIRLGNVGSEILITLNEPIRHPRVSVNTHAHMLAYACIVYNTILISYYSLYLLMYHI